MRIKVTHWLGSTRTSFWRELLPWWIVILALRCEVSEEFLNPKVKRKTVTFVFVGNKDDPPKKFFLIISVNLTAVVPPSHSYYPSIWHPPIPYINQIHFRKVRWWRNVCHQCIQPHWESWRKFWWLGYFQRSQKDVIKWMSFIRLATFTPISTPLTYSPVYFSLTDCCQGKNSQNEWEGCTLPLKFAYRTYNMLSISDVLKKTTI